MKQRDYEKLSTATLVKIQGRTAQDSAEERAVREELRRRGEMNLETRKPGSKKYGTRGSWLPGFQIKSP